jgi:hypothetical protein
LDEEVLGKQQAMEGQPELHPQVLIHLRQALASPVQEEEQPLDAQVQEVAVVRGQEEE